jgi:hypothetical protein
MKSVLIGLALSVPMAFFLLGLFGVAQAVEDHSNVSNLSDSICYVTIPPVPSPSPSETHEEEVGHTATPTPTPEPSPTETPTEAPTPTPTIDPTPTPTV